MVAKLMAILQMNNLSYPSNRAFSPVANFRIFLLHGRHAGVQQRTVVNGEKHFNCRYGATQAANCPSLAN